MCGRSGGLFPRESPRSRPALGHGFPQTAIEVPRERHAQKPIFDVFQATSRKMVLFRQNERGARFLIRHVRFQHPSSIEQFDADGNQEFGRADEAEQEKTFNRSADLGAESEVSMASSETLERTPRRTISTKGFS